MRRVVRGGSYRAVARNTIIRAPRSSLGVERANGDGEGGNTGRGNGARDRSSIRSLAVVSRGRHDHDAEAIGARRPDRVGSSRQPCLTAPPSDMLMTRMLHRRRLATTQSMALITLAARPLPCASSTFRLMMFAPGATPRVSSNLFTPDAAMIPATCVPCPCSSIARPRASVKSWLAMMRPAAPASSLRPYRSPRRRCRRR